MNRLVACCCAGHLAVTQKEASYRRLHAFTIYFYEIIHTQNLITLRIGKLRTYYAWAVKVIIDGVNYSINSNNQTASVVNGKKNLSSGDIKIAESVTYKDQIYKVTAIEEKAFSNCKNLTSVTIPDGVTSIGEDAFRNCTGLLSVIIQQV